MERRLKLTKRTIDQLNPDVKRLVVWDTDLAGFGVRVEPTGSKSYIIRYRAEGGGRNAPQRFMTIGGPDALTPDEARRKAKEILGAVMVGEDPADKLAAARKEMAIAELCDLYLAEAVLLPTRRGTVMKSSTLASVKGLISVHIKPLLGPRRISSIQPKDIERFQMDVAMGKTRVLSFEPGKRLGRLPTGGKGVASHAVSLVSAIFSYARKLGLVKSNPCTGVSRFASRNMERFLSTDELERLGAALDEGETTGFPWHPDPTKKLKHAPKPEKRMVKLDKGAVAAIRLLLLTGARCGEILSLQWDWVDLERGILFLPDSKTGKKAIILNGPALVVLEAQDRVGPFVFPGLSSDAPRADLKRPWATVCRHAGLKNVRVHDLRHTHASFGVSAGFGLPIVGKLLGHSQPQTTARYAHLDIDPVRRASDAIGKTLADALDGRSRTGVRQATAVTSFADVKAAPQGAVVNGSLASTRRAASRRGSPAQRMR